MNTRKKATPASYPGVKFVYSPSPDSVDTNILILAHGMGDTPENFLNFGKKMDLPQTAVLAIKAPFPVPYHEGTCWAPVFDAYGNEHPPSSPVIRDSISKTRKLLADFIHARILATTTDDDPQRWPARNIFLFGFSQGGAAVVDVALFGPVGPLGGAVSVSGWPNEASYGGTLPRVNGEVKVLVTQGDGDDVVGEWRKEAAFLNRVIGTNGSLTTHVVPGKGHSMPMEAGEMRAIMTFFGAHLVLRNLALENMADVYQVKKAEKV
ncbi:hypothetical protein PhCBS80983_g05173 [Powellomyces hirtus]|uniref:Phospholipase/carboxylesterase/thioesterase domain-containing protein n=1 Tax=Powellomyces hirtus TaxID=109895 RepID=A0A507DWU7_9FUNG|nr:hypothetical protein PhCBS80983_g05173 [Powellomyces hirtus]